LKAVDRRILAFGLRFPWPIVGVAALVLVGAVVLYSRTGSDFLPPFNEGTATVGVTARPGISIEASTALARRAEELLRAMPEVASVGRRTGRAEMDEHAEGVHSSEIDVDFRPGSGTRSEVLEKVRRALVDLPGVSVSVGQPISHRLDHLLSGVRAQVAVKIFGQELSTLRGHAETVRTLVAGIRGVRDLQVERQVLVPQIRVEPRREAIARLGLHADSVVRFVETAQGGRTVTEIVDGNRSYPVVVSLGEGVANADALRRTPFPLPGGAQVPLSDVADVVETVGPNQILRDDAQRRIAVTFNVEGRDLGAVVAELQSGLAHEVEPHLPTGYRIEIGGQFEAQQAAAKLMLIFGIAGLLGVFALLWAHFRSTGAVVQILLNVPFALIGSVVATWLTGGVVTIAHLVGFVSLTGIAARNGIMMIDHYRHLVLEEGETFTPEMIVRGSLDRLVPVLMTAATAILGLVPVVLASGQPGKEILFPVAVVVLGGLISSTILDIVVTPVVFRLFGRRTIDAAIRHRSSEASHELA
jgi:Cu/Ag efflux pump CusA